MSIERTDIMNRTTQPIRVYRGDYIESTHDIHIAVVNTKGNLLAYYGDANRLTFARSSMKPIQAVPIVETGAIEKFNVSEKELSLFCASHAGESFHRKSVQNVLEKLGLEEENLHCGTHIPSDIDSYNELIRSGGKLTPIFSNCSGKHSGMLAACLAQNIDINSYEDLDNPYQQQIIDVIADVSQYKREKINTAVDGCGVPVHRLPLYNLALAFARLAKPEDWIEGNEARKTALARIRDAMMKFPEMVAGTKKFDTDLMTVYDCRIVAKGGAEGVHCFGDKEMGIGVAIKVEDGNGRAASVSSMEVLKQLGIGSEDEWNQLERYSTAPVLNMWENVIGSISANFTLHHI